MEKTTVTIVAPDGVAKTFTGDTALVFTLSDIDGFLKDEVPQINAESAYVGISIPEVFFIEVISSLVGTFIEDNYKENPSTAAFNTREVALRLLARSDRILESCPREHLEEEFSKITELLANINRKATQHGRSSDGRE